MEHFCFKCDRLHIRPAGWSCIIGSMATNVTSNQVSVAPSAFLTQQLMGRSPSPISITSSCGSVNRSTITATSSMGSIAQQSNARTDELILAELQKPSARMTQVEQELQAKTFTSIPKKERRLNKRDRQVIVHCVVPQTDQQVFHCRKVQITQGVRAAYRSQSTLSHPLTPQPPTSAAYLPNITPRLSCKDNISWSYPLGQN